MRYQDKRISLVIMITLFFRRDILSDNILHNYCISLSSPRHAYQLFSSKSPLRLYFFLYVKSKGVKDRQHNVFTFYLQRAIVVVPQGNRSKFSDPKINKKKEKNQHSNYVSIIYGSPLSFFQGNAISFPRAIVESVSTVTTTLLNSFLLTMRLLLATLTLFFLGIGVLR